MSSSRHVLLSLWLHSDGSAVDDPSLLHVLQRPYDKRRGDSNLGGPKAQWLTHFLSADRWRSTLELVSASALNLGRDLLDRDGVCEDASLRAAKMLSAKIEQIRARANLFGSAEDRLAVDVEQKLSDPDLRRCSQTPDRGGHPRCVCPQPHASA